MNHQNHLAGVASAFPFRQYPKMLGVQAESFEILANGARTNILELPTGSGKTAIGYTFLKHLAKQGAGPLFYIVPTKALVDQVHALHPDTVVAYGRNEHPCIFFPEEEALRANDIPCAMLTECPHRVDQTTGKTHTRGALPCPYLQQKYEAKQAKIVVCTMSFYLFTQLFSQEWEQPAGLVIDEVHRLAEVFRGALSYDITDYHLSRGIELLQLIGAHEEAKQLQDFLHAVVSVVRRKPTHQRVLLEDTELRKLVNAVCTIDAAELRKKVKAAIQSGAINPYEQREVLERLEVITRDLYRYLRSFEYSLETEQRGALNYTYATHTPEPGEGRLVRHRLSVKAYYMPPLIKRILGKTNLAYSATIGDPQMLVFETGIAGTFSTFSTTFPDANARVYMPTDTANLAVSNRSRQEPTKSLRRIARACALFAKHGHRSLVITVSEAERKKFLELAAEEHLHVLSYDQKLRPREAKQLFANGKADTLCGTVSHFGEGLDLPKQMAPIIFVLRPGYPVPDDPQTKFEERRFGNRRWALWNWRVMVQALQSRGRNIRSDSDVGVTFFMSQQFRRFAFAMLPEELRRSYRGNNTFEEAVADTLRLLSRTKDAQKIA